MSITIKSEREIDIMRKAGEILANVHQKLAKEIQVGMSTYEIDQIGEDLIREYGCIPSFKNQQGYPASICISINDEVVHGIPSQKRIVKEGDIISVDLVAYKDGFNGDCARTYVVGKTDKVISRVCFPQKA